MTTILDCRPCAMADAFAVLRIGGSFDDAEKLSGIPAREISRAWDQSVPEEGDCAQPEREAA